MSAVIRLAFVAACLLPLAAPAQKLFKCVDAKGRITYQEAACPTDKEQKKVDTSHAGKTDWNRAADEKVKRMTREAEEEAAYQDKLARRARAEQEEKRKLEEDAYRKKLLEQAGNEAPPPKAKK